MTDSILIVGGELALRRELAAVLSQAGFTATGVSDYSEAYLRLDEVDPDIVIVDEVLQCIDGRDACYRIRNYFGIPVILLGQDSSGEAYMRAVEAGADLYVRKPFSCLELAARVKVILRRYKKLRQNRGEQPGNRKDMDTRDLASAGNKELLKASKGKGRVKWHRHIVSGIRPRGKSKMPSRSS